MLGKPTTKKFRLNTTQAIVLAFFCVILLGACLLMLPGATKSSGSLSFVDALFTATSATCVTGLAVANTFETFTIFGQIVILFLIQFGGLGYLSLSSAIYLVFGMKITLSRKLSLSSDFGQSNMGTYRRLIKNVLVLTLIIEGAGAILLSAGFSRYYSAGRAIYMGIFHSISAFCNAGFDIVSIGSGSLTAFASDPLILLTIAALIILGGLGFIVISEVITRRHIRKFTLHSKVVLSVTAALIVLGTVVYMILEYNNPLTIGNMNFGDKLLNCFFMSVTPRTAGFNSVSTTGMTNASTFFTIVLMFIGASPASTGGGIKTTTLFVLIFALFAVLQQRKQAVIDKRKIGHQTIVRASSVLLLAVVVLSVSMLIMLAVEPFSFEELLFEQVSAYATVGLSLGITSSLTVTSKLVLIFNMYVGRVGALTFFLSFTKQEKIESKILYAESNILI